MDGVMRESILPWDLNGKRQTPLLCSPGEEEALFTGMLLTSQTVRNAASIRVEKGAEGVWHVCADLAPDPPKGLEERVGRIVPCASSLRAPMQRIEELSEQLMALSRDGGQHSGLLAVGDTVVISRDIGRHNALDKVIGHIVAAGLPLSEAIYCTSGRVSIEILSKAASVGIPILCTCKQVGDLALRHAEAWDVAIVQRGRKAQVFGAAWRVEGGDGAAES